MEKAAKIAVSGRPGTVWIDIPLDVQASRIDVENLKGYDDEILPVHPKKNEIDKLIDRLNASERPAVVLGNGVRLADAVDEVRTLLDYLKVPVFVSWNGVDLIEEDYQYYYGRPNIVGHRAANLILQNADFVLSIGTRLSLLNTGYNFSGYLKNAYHVMVDVDVNEMNKKSLHPQQKIASDAKLFILDLLERKKDIMEKDHKGWIGFCDDIRGRYPVRIDEQKPREGYVSIYDLFDVLSDLMIESDIYQFTSSGTSVDIGMKVLRLKRGQRAFLNKSMAAMGYDIPASIGSCIGDGKKRTICVTGDGSVAMNMQELEVIRRLNLPIKLFVTDNQGYSMIWHSQSGNFSGHLTGCTEESGLTLPDMSKIADAFGIKSVIIDGNSDLEKEVKRVMPLVEKINGLEEEMSKLSDSELRGKTDYFKKQLEEGKTLDDILPEAFAVVREASKRVLGMRHFDVQLIGGIILHQGRISEMAERECWRKKSSESRCSFVPRAGALLLLIIKWLTFLQANLQAVL